MSDYFQKHLIKDEAYDMLPERLTLQTPDFDEERYVQDEKVTDIERIFLSSSDYCQKKSDKNFQDICSVQSSHNPTCSKQ